MSTAVPASYLLTCPRCHGLRSFMMADNLTGRCGGCEWTFSFTTQSPTGTTNAAITAGSSTAISVASGGASFTSGMKLLIDTGQNAEVVTVTGTPTGTSIPVPAGFARNHNSAVTFGQLLISSAYAGIGVGTAVPLVSPYLGGG
jgi:hypothetical protein